MKDVFTQPNFITQKLCLKCRVCCRFSSPDTPIRPYLDAEEVLNLSPYIQDIYLPHIDNRRGTRIGLVQKKDVCVCPFFDTDKSSCNVYKRRPFDCQLYPFVVMENKHRNAIVVGADFSCPIIRSMWGKESFKKYVEYLEEYFNKNLTEYLEKNHCSIMEYQASVQKLFSVKRSTERFLPIGLKKICIRDKDIIQNFFNKYNSFLSSYSFLSIFIWKDILHIAWKIIEDHLFIFAKTGGWFLLLPPIGNGHQLSTGMDILKQLNGKDSAVSRIENLALQDCEEPYLDFKKSDLEYICLTKELVELKGDRYKSKRANCNYFNNRYKYTYRNFSRHQTQEAIALYLRWAKKRIRNNQSQDKYNEDEYYNMLISDSALAHQTGMLYAERLGLEGRVIYINNKIEGYTFGFPLRQDTFCILFEIAEPEIKGLAQWMFREFCKEHISYRYISLMGDSGLENLKKVKTSYRPIVKIPVFTTSYFI